MAYTGNGIAGMMGAVDKTADVYAGNPQKLRQAMGNQPAMGNISEDLINALALQKVTSEKEAAKNQMMLSQQQNPNTIVDQLEQKATNLTKNEVVGQVGDVLKQKQARQQKAQQKMVAQAAKPQGTGIASMLGGQKPQARPMPPQARPMPPQARPMPQGRPMPPQGRPMPQGMPQQGIVAAAAGGLMRKYDNGGLVTADDITDAEVQAFRESTRGRFRGGDAFVKKFLADRKNEEFVKQTKKGIEQAPVFNPDTGKLDVAATNAATQAKLDAALAPPPPPPAPTETPEQKLAGLDALIGQEDAQFAAEDAAAAQRAAQQAAAAKEAADLQAAYTRADDYGKAALDAAGSTSEMVVGDTAQKAGIETLQDLGALDKKGAVIAQPFKTAQETARTDSDDYFKRQGVADVYQKQLEERKEFYGPRDLEAERREQAEAGIRNIGRGKGGARQANIASARVRDAQQAAREKQLLGGQALEREGLAKDFAIAEKGQGVYKDVGKDATALMTAASQHLATMQKADYDAAIADLKSKDAALSRQVDRKHSSGAERAR